MAASKNKDLAPKRLEQLRRVLRQNQVVRIEELCDHAIWLDRGELVMTGRVRAVLDAYRDSNPARV